MLISGAIDLATPRKLVVVPGDEVVVGDRMQDYGILRQVTGIGASVIGQSVVLSFASNDGFRDRVHVPLFQTVSIWRVCRDR